MSSICREYKKNGIRDIGTDKILGTDFWSWLLEPKVTRTLPPSPLTISNHLPFWIFQSCSLLQLSNWKRVWILPEAGTILVSSAVRLGLRARSIDWEWSHLCCFQLKAVMRPCEFSTHSCPSGGSGYQRWVVGIVSILESLLEKSLQECCLTHMALGWVLSLRFGDCLFLLSGLA